MKVDMQYSVRAFDIYLASLKEDLKVELEEFSATTYLARLFFAATFYDHEDFRKVLPAGISVTSQMARSIAFKLSDQGNAGGWHLRNIVLAIWVSRNYTAQEAINYQLDTAYFGNNQYGLRQATKFYFSKTLDKISSNEMFSLIALLKSPSYYNPYCRPERLTARADYLLKSLNNLDPTGYSSLIYTLPEFTQHSGITCK